MLRNIVLIFLAINAGPRVTVNLPDVSVGSTAAFASTLPRKIYRYSVVAGGVYSPEELAAARRNDAVVAEHYSDFGNQTAVTKLTSDMFVYVSYRKGNKVFWTTKKHRVCSGETVITDGKNMARTRCANRLSKAFKLPVNAKYEPPEPALSMIDPPPLVGESPGDPGTLPYPGLPAVQDFPVEVAKAEPGSAHSGASGQQPAVRTGAGDSLGDPGLPFPQLLPVIGSPFLAALGTPGGGTTGSGGTTGAGTTTAGGSGTLIPEGSSFFLVLCGAFILMLFRRLGI